MALGIDLNDSWTIRPTIMGQVQKADGSFSQERSSATTGKYQTVQYNPESSKDKWLQAALTIEGKIGNFDLVYAFANLNLATAADLFVEPSLSWLELVVASLIARWCFGSATLARLVGERHANGGV